jgi:hypothetical protein
LSPGVVVFFLFICSGGAAPRNRTDAWPARAITRAEMEEWSERFEAPTAEELARYDN